MRHLNRYLSCADMHKDHDVNIRFPAMLAALAVSVTAYAHHGWSEYDSGQVLNLSGTIVESGYEHPHGHVRLQVPGKTWLVVLAPPSRMENRRNACHHAQSEYAGDGGRVSESK